MAHRNRNLRLLVLAMTLLVAWTPAHPMMDCLVGSEDQVPEASLVGIATVQNASCGPDPQQVPDDDDDQSTYAYSTMVITLRFSEVWKGRADEDVMLEAKFGCVQIGLCDDTRRSLANGERIIAVVAPPREGSQARLVAFRFVEETSAAELAEWKAAVARSLPCTEARHLAAGPFCLDVPCEYSAVMTDALTDVWTGYIEPRDHSWRVEWRVGAYDSLLSPNEVRIVFWRRDVTVNGGSWSLALVDDGEDHVLVLGDGAVEFNTLEGTTDAIGLLTSIAATRGSRQADATCIPFRAPKDYNLQYPRAVRRQQ